MAPPMRLNYQHATASFAAVLITFLGLPSASTLNAQPLAAGLGQYRFGMTRQQVYELLGLPRKVRPVGDVEHCQTAVWGIPHDSHGWGHWTVKFNGDTVSDVSATHATASASASASP